MWFTNITQNGKMLIGDSFKSSKHIVIHKAPATKQYKSLGINQDRILKIVLINFWEAKKETGSITEETNRNKKK